MSARVIKNAHAAQARALIFSNTDGSEIQPETVICDYAPADVSVIFPQLQIRRQPLAVQDTAQTIHAAEQNASAITENAAAEAAKIVARAEADAQLIEQAAHERGLAQARQSAESEIAARVEIVRAELTETIAQISELYTVVTKQAENDLLRLAFDIARKIVGREIALNPQIALDLARTNLARLQNRAVAQLHLHPEDFAFVTERREQLSFNGALELVADDSIAPGGCLVRSENGDLDARIEPQFDEIARQLFA